MDAGETGSGLPLGLGDSARASRVFLREAGFGLKRWRGCFLCVLLLGRVRLGLTLLRIDFLAALILDFVLRVDMTGAVFFGRTFRKKRGAMETGTVDCLENFSQNAPARAQSPVGLHAALPFSARGAKQNQFPVGIIFCGDFHTLRWVCFAKAQFLF